MTQSNPDKADAILGGQNPPPATNAILGGLAGAKQRLASETLVARLSALKDAFQYGDEGIALAVQALNDPDEAVQQLACRLLRSQDNEKARQTLLDHQPLRYFTTLSNWRWESYNPQVGITDPDNNAYVVRMTNSGRSGRSQLPEAIYDLSQFEALLQDPRVAELQALIFQMDYNYWDESHTFGVALEAICEAKESFPNLKAMFVGDSEGDRAPEFRKSKVKVFDIAPFLKAFPQLEVLQVFGYFGGYAASLDLYTLECEGLRHDNLKSLIIETADITQQNLEQVCSMDLPNLEYFELWFGRNYEYQSALLPLKPILAGDTYPQLKYLGLCSSEESKTLIQEVIDAPIIEQLTVLDLQMGTVSDSHLQPLLNNSATSNLKVLNVTGNLLSDGAIAQLSQQSFQVISTYQFASNDYDCEYYDEETEDYGERRMNRHMALHE